VYYFSSFSFAGQQFTEMVTSFKENNLKKARQIQVRWYICI